MKAVVAAPIRSASGPTERARSADGAGLSAMEADHRRYGITESWLSSW